MRSCAWIGNSNPCITCVSMLFTILSMSNCQGICFLMTDGGVSIGTGGWGVLVYSISGGLMVLTGCISKSGCFSDSLCKAVCAGVNCCGFVIPPYIATTIKPQLYPTPSLSTEHAHRGCTTWLTE